MKILTVECNSWHFPFHLLIGLVSESQCRWLAWWLFCRESGGRRRNNVARLVVRVSALCFLRCFDTVVWAPGRNPTHKSILYCRSANVLFCNKWMKKTGEHLCQCPTDQHRALNTMLLLVVGCLHISLFLVEVAVTPMRFSWLFAPPTNPATHLREKFLL